MNVIPQSRSTPASHNCRAAFLCRWLVALVLLLAGFTGFCGRAGRPNVVFILADDLGYGDIGPFGQKIIRTPALDMLAQKGMKFTQHYSGAPVCAPSRCVLLTGRHPGHAFVRDNREVGEWNAFTGQIPIPADEPGLATLLGNAGYVTAAIGKWGLGGVGSSGDPLKQGFAQFFGYNCQRHAHNYYPHYLNDGAGKMPLPGNTNVLIKEGLSLPAGADANDGASYAAFVGKQYAPDLFCERALQFIRDNKDRPFFLYYPTPAPHLPLQVPDDSLGEYKGKLDDKPYAGGGGYLPQQHPHAAYAAMVTRLDRDIGRMVQLIRSLGLEKDTIFIFTSDNGATFPLAGYDPDYFQSNGGLRGHKGSLYEGGVRVPLIVCWEGHVPPNTTSTRVTGFEDWLPTLLELVGRTNLIPQSADGIGFAATLLGQNQSSQKFLYREFHGSGGQQSVRVGDWKLLRQPLRGDSKAAAVPKVELYDLSVDPNEMSNVAAAHPDVVERLLKIMEAEHRPSKEFPLPALDVSGRQSGETTHKSN